MYTPPSSPLRPPPMWDVDFDSLDQNLPSPDLAWQLHDIDQHGYEENATVYSSLPVSSLLQTLQGSPSRTSPLSPHHPPLFFPSAFPPSPEPPSPSLSFASPFNRRHRSRSPFLLGRLPSLSPSKVCSKRARHELSDSESEENNCWVSRDTRRDLFNRRMEATRVSMDLILPQSPPVSNVESESDSDDDEPSSDASDGESNAESDDEGGSGPYIPPIASSSTAISAPVRIRSTRPASTSVAPDTQRSRTTVNRLHSDVSDTENANPTRALTTKKKRATHAAPTFPGGFNPVSVNVDVDDEPVRVTRAAARVAAGGTTAIAVSKKPKVVMASPANARAGPSNAAAPPHHQGNPQVVQGKKAPRLRAFDETVLNVLLRSGDPAICGIGGCERVLLPSNVKGAREHIRLHYRRGDAFAMSFKSDLKKLAKDENEYRGASRCRVANCEVVLDESPLTRHTVEKHLKWRYVCPACNPWLEDNDSAVTVDFSRGGSVSRHIKRFLGSPGHETCKSSCLSCLRAPSRY